MFMCSLYTDNMTFLAVRHSSWVKAFLSILIPASQELISSHNLKPIFDMATTIPGFLREFCHSSPAETCGDSASGCELRKTFEWSRVMWTALGVSRAGWRKPRRASTCELDH